VMTWVGSTMTHKSVCVFKHLSKHRVLKYLACCAVKVLWTMY
jgi:hypothetical protein